MRKVSLMAGLVTLAGALAACSGRGDITAPSAVASPRLGASAAVTSRTNEKNVLLSYEGTNPCNGEVVSGSVTAHIVDVVTFTKNGGMTLVSNVRSHGTLTGAESGNAYAVSGKQMNTMQANGSGGAFQLQTKLTATGPTPGTSFTISYSERVTVDADGNTTVTFSTPTTRCGK
jgi:hypothetical protein